MQTIHKKKVNKLLEEFGADTIRNAGMETKIVVKIGAKIMLRRNIDLTKGLVNSATGVVMGVTYIIDDP